MARKPHAIGQWSFPSPLPSVSTSHRMSSGTKESSLDARQSLQQVPRLCKSQLGGQESKTSRPIKGLVGGQAWQEGNFIISLFILFQPLTLGSEPKHQSCFLPHILLGVQQAPGPRVPFILPLNARLYSSTLLFGGPRGTSTPSIPLLLTKSSCAM